MFGSMMQHPLDYQVVTVCSYNSKETLVGHASSQHVNIHIMGTPPGFRLTSVTGQVSDKLV